MPTSTGDGCSKADLLRVLGTGSCSLDSASLSIAGAVRVVLVAAPEVA